MDPERPWAGRQLHFVGIGGAGMSGLALVAHALGASVTGSDRDAGSPYAGRLAGAGIEVAEGHDARHVPAGAEVVYSTAVAEDNPERAGAEGQLHRADLLAELTRLKPTIAVSGTHGKTTTTSMIVHALLACGFEPSYLVGGDVRTTGTNAAWGEGEWLVVEADESDRSLLKLDKRIAVVTNVELDHHTTYASLKEVEETFAHFLAGAVTAVVSAPVRRMVPPGPAVVVPHGAPDLHLAIPGAHNLSNAALALEACVQAGADGQAAAASLASFEGAARRFEEVGVTATGARVVDDYAHHPTEVAATIAAARTLEHRRLVVAFQPHLYSRTAHEAAEFARALAAADLVVVCDVYPARERSQDWPGITGLLIAEATADLAAGRPVCWLPRLEDAQRFLRGELRVGDLLLTLGAGDIDGVARTLVEVPPGRWRS